MACGWDIPIITCMWRWTAPVRKNTMVLVQLDKIDGKLVKGKFID